MAWSSLLLGAVDLRKVSASSRQILGGDFVVLSLAQKLAFPGERRLELPRFGSRFPLNSKEGQASYPD
jgi:hypothetical protein